MVRMVKGGGREGRKWLRTLVSQRRRSGSLHVAGSGGCVSDAVMGGMVG